VAARQARQLLHRWGVVSRETLAAEEGAWDWGLLYNHLSLLEMRGEVRRGKFVEGLPGLQFALPDVVESLRARRDAITTEDAPLILLNAGDPANLYGPSRPDAPVTFARRPATWLVQQRGHPLIVIEGGGAAITTLPGHTEDSIAAAVQRWRDHLTTTEHALRIESWNGQPILNSPGKTILESLNFRRDYPAMTWEKQW
jgi:ATP-dependent Lhr-like helicase